MATLQHATITAQKLWTDSFSYNTLTFSLLHIINSISLMESIYFQNMNSQTSRFKIVCHNSFLKLTFCISFEVSLRHQVWSRSLWCFPCLHQTVKKQNTKYRYIQYFAASNWFPLQNLLHATQHGGEICLGTSWTPLNAASAKDGREGIRFCEDKALFCP